MLQFSLYGLLSVSILFCDSTKYVSSEHLRFKAISHNCIIVIMTELIVIGRPSN